MRVPVYRVRVESFQGIQVPPSPNIQVRVLSFAPETNSQQPEFYVEVPDEYRGEFDHPPALEEGFDVSLFDLLSEPQGAEDAGAGRWIHEEIERLHRERDASEPNSDVADYP
jgi:hypothetical protein